LLSNGITKAKVKKLNALQCAIGSKVSSQQALELLDLMPTGLTLNIGVVAQSTDLLTRLAQELEALKASRSVAPAPVLEADATIITDKPA